MRPVTLYALMVSTAGCFPSLGDCDEPGARTVYFSDDEAGDPAYGGQALLNQSCGDGSFCHAAAATNQDRYGATNGLDFDLSLATDAESTDRLRDDQLRTFRWRHAILRTVDAGNMPPGEAGDEVLAFARTYRELPAIDTDEGREILRNWLACGAPVVERTSARPSEITPVGAILGGMNANCAAGEALCADRCVDVQSSGSNCGACGVVCGAGQPCVAGACSSDCTGTLMRCGSACVDSTSDVSNCGACGNACADGSVCFESACSTDGCPGTTTDCGGSCVDTQSSAANCGDCGFACAGTACESGVCACGDTTSDPLNCGACGNVCPARAVCTASSCECVAPTSLCGTNCVDVVNDASNCGRCGNACGAGQVCRDGSCASCGDGVSFRADVQPIFDASCAGSRCHSGTRAAGDLALDRNSYANLVGVASSCGRPLVAPGDAPGSYLMSKLLGVDMCRGNSMPLRDSALPAAQLDLIEQWICGGAPNN